MALGRFDHKNSILRHNLWLSVNLSLAFLEKIPHTEIISMENSKSDIAQRKERDEHGHFLHVDPSQSSSNSQHPTIENLPGISIEKTKDDNTLVDVHVNNPLKRIETSLKEIKKQKAFSFDIRGSLGLAGIAIALTTFGIFGGSHALCGKGIQSHLGTIKSLQLMDEAEN